MNEPLAGCGLRRTETSRRTERERERVAGKKLPSVSFSLVAVTAMFQRISTLRGARKPAPRVIDVTARLFAFLLRFTDVFSFLLSNIVFHHECANRRITVSSLNSIHIFITVAQSGASSFFKRLPAILPPLTPMTEVGVTKQDERREKNELKSCPS